MRTQATSCQTHTTFIISVPLSEVQLFPFVMLQESELQEDEIYHKDSNQTCDIIPHFLLPEFTIYLSQRKIPRGTFV